MSRSWPGAFNAPTGLEGECHIFVEDKGDYYTIDDELPQFRAQHAVDQGRGRLSASRLAAGSPHRLFGDLFEPQVRVSENRFPLFRMMVY